MTQELVVCNGCGRRVFDDRRTCPYCGSRELEHEKVAETSVLTVKVCRDCAKPMLDPDLECPYCGAASPRFHVETFLLGLLVGLVALALLLLIL